MKEGHFVAVDLTNLESGYLTPSPSREVAILKILGGQDERCEEHAPTALQGAERGHILWLLHSKVMLGYVRFDENQVVKSDLESREACPGPAQRLLNEGSERKNTPAVCAVGAAARH